MLFETPSINLKEFDQDDIPILLGVSCEGHDGKILNRELFIGTLNLQSLLDYDPEDTDVKIGFRNITKLDLSRDELRSANFNTSDLFQICYASEIYTMKDPDIARLEKSNTFDLSTKNIDDYFDMK